MASFGRLHKHGVWFYTIALLSDNSPILIALIARYVVFNGLISTAYIQNNALRLLTNAANKRSFMQMRKPLGDKKAFSVLLISFSLIFGNTCLLALKIASRQGRSSALV